MGLLTGVGRGLLDLIYPPLCWLCEMEVSPSESHLLLCAVCEEGLRALPRDRCPGCGKVHLRRSGCRALCYECRSGTRRFDRAIGVYVYDGTFRSLWHRVKFSGQRQWIGPIVDAALSHLTPEDEFNPYLFDVYTWVPTTDSRKATRGFDPAEDIARHLAAKYSRPVAQLIHRIRDCPPQFELSRPERQKNVEGAFAAAVPRDIRTRAALLVDDILTTGATASACASALKSRGFQKVVLFTVSRG